MLKDILKKLRQDKKLTQAELAKKIGVTQSTIAGIEIGRREPSIELMTQLAEYFDVSVDYLLGIKETDDKEESLVKDLLVHLYNAGLIKDINNIDETTTDMIMSMVKKELELISKK